MSIRDNKILICFFVFDETDKANMRQFEIGSLVTKVIRNLFKINLVGLN